MWKLTLQQLERHSFVASEFKEYLFGVLFLKRYPNEFEAVRERVIAKIPAEERGRATAEALTSLVDDMIIHEPARIGHPRDTPVFWATVQHALPDHEQRRARLTTTDATPWLG